MYSLFLILKSDFSTHCKHIFKSQMKGSNSFKKTSNILIFLTNYYLTKPSKLNN